LNEKEEKHKELEKFIDKYIKNALEDSTHIHDDYNSLTEDISNTARTILKDAWEQAKNEGNHKKITVIPDA
jgi:hypothetical protein